MNMQDKKQNLKNEKNEEEIPDIPDIWKILEERKKRGLWDGEIKIHQIKEYPLSKGEHYFIISNNPAREVMCISCPLQHGGILEAHMLARYKVENGVIYLDGKPTNKASNNSIDKTKNLD